MAQNTQRRVDSFFTGWILSATTGQSEIIKVISKYEIISASEQDAPKGWLKTQDGHYISKSLVVQKNTLGKAYTYLKLIDFEWTNSDFGLARFKIIVKNNSVFDINDPQFEINYYSKSNTKLDTGYESVDEVIPAKSTKILNIEELAHSQSYRANISINDAR